MKRIIVRADDLGFSEAVNYGIEKSVKEGIIRSVGIMVNMPATMHGWNLIKDEKVCFGLHTNICVGKPLVDPTLIPSITNGNGQFKTSREYRNSTVDFVNYDEVKLEIEAQYKRFVEITGHKPHYFEGHAVASQIFLQALEDVANQYGCDYLGMSMDHANRFRNSNVYISMESMLPDYDPFVSFKKACQREFNDGGVCMFVCHPGYLDDYILSISSLTLPRVKEVTMLCSDETKKYIQENNISIITYDDLE